MSYEGPFRRFLKGERVLGQRLPVTNLGPVDSNVKSEIQAVQSKWRGMGWTQATINAATDQAVGYAEGIARFVAPDDPAMQEKVIENLFKSGDAQEVATRFGEGLRKFVGLS
jgi:hypothetical protein